MRYTLYLTEKQCFVEKSFHILQRNRRRQEHVRIPIVELCLDSMTELIKRLGANIAFVSEARRNVERVPPIMEFEQKLSFNWEDARFESGVSSLINTRYLKISLGEYSPRKPWRSPKSDMDLDSLPAQNMADAQATLPDTAHGSSRWCIPVGFRYPWMLLHEKRYALESQRCLTQSHPGRL